MKSFSWSFYEKNFVMVTSPGNPDQGFEKARPQQSVQRSQPRPRGLSSASCRGSGRIHAPRSHHGKENLEDRCLSNMGGLNISSTCRFSRAADHTSLSSKDLFRFHEKCWKACSTNLFARPKRSSYAPPLQCLHLRPIILFELR